LGDWDRPVTETHSSSNASSTVNGDSDFYESDSMGSQISSDELAPVPMQGVNMDIAPLELVFPIHLHAMGFHPKGTNHIPKFKALIQYCGESEGLLFFCIELNA
jgi:hypothetical protein